MISCGFQTTCLGSYFLFTIAVKLHNYCLWVYFNYTKQILFPTVHIYQSVMSWEVTAPPIRVIVCLP